MRLLPLLGGAHTDEERAEPRGDVVVQIERYRRAGSVICDVRRRTRTS